MFTADYLDSDGRRVIILEVQSEIVAFLFFGISGESGVSLDIVQRPADYSVTDEYVLLQICCGFTEEICVCRYVCIYRQTY